MFAKLSKLKTLLKKYVNFNKFHKWLFMSLGNW